MKQTWFFLFFLFAAVSSFATELPKRSLYIEGSAEQSAHRTFFMTNFRMEASALGFTVTDNKDEAAFTFKFHVQGHTSENDPSVKHIISISLIDNETGAEMVSFGWPFSQLEDMYEYNQHVFYIATVLIPGTGEDTTVIAQAADDNKWKNKWLYIRASVDYPVTFYALQGTGLIGGQGSYVGTYESPAYVQHIEHKILPQPGITVGAELQFLNFMSSELNLQFNMGDPKTYAFLTWLWELS